MAIAYDNSSNGYAAATSLTYSHTCTGENLILIINVSCSGNTITGVKYNNVSATQISTTRQNSSGEWLSLWYLVNPSTGANNVVVSSSSGAAITSECASYTGAKQSGQPDNYTDGGVGTLTTSYSVSNTSSADNCWTIMGGTNGFNGNTQASAGTATTLRQVYPLGSGGSWICDSNSAKTPAGSVTLQMTTTVNNNFTGIAISIAPYAPSGPSSISTYKGLASASVATKKGLALASIASDKGLA